MRVLCVKIYYEMTLDPIMDYLSYSEYYMLSQTDFLFDYDLLQKNHTANL